MVVVVDAFDCYFPVIGSQETGGMKERVISTFENHTCFILSPLHFSLSDFLSHFLSHFNYLINNDECLLPPQRHTLFDIPSQ